MKTTKRAVQVVCALGAICTIVWLRVIGWKLTEGQLIVNYWPQWVVVVMLSVVVVLIERNIRNN